MTNRDMQEVARRLRGHERRLGRLESRKEPEGEINLLRVVDEQLGTDDTVVSVTVNTGAEFVADTSDADGADLVG